MNRALLIIDVQNFYFSGPRKLENCIEASLNARRLLEHFRKSCQPVFHIRHVLGDIPAGQENILEIHDNVKPAEGEAIIFKHTPGSFNGTGLLDMLREKGINELVICGMMSHMCVDTTTREAFDLGFSNIVVHDACTTRNLSFNGVTAPAAHVHAASMAALSAFAKVVSCEDLGV